MVWIACESWLLEPEYAVGAEASCPVPVTADAAMIFSP